MPIVEIGPYRIYQDRDGTLWRAEGDGWPSEAWIDGAWKRVTPSEQDLARMRSPSRPPTRWERQVMAGEELTPLTQAELDELRRRC